MTIDYMLALCTAPWHGKQKTSIDIRQAPLQYSDCKGCANDNLTSARTNLNYLASAQCQDCTYYICIVKAPCIAQLRVQYTAVFCNINRKNKRLSIILSENDNSSTSDENGLYQGGKDIDLMTLHFQKCLQNCITFESKANWILLCFNLLFLVSRIHCFSLQRFSFEANSFLPGGKFWTCQTSHAYGLPFKKV